MESSLQFTGERLIPGQVDLELEIEHRNRYYFAQQLAKQGRVLDAACGEGYGTALLAEQAKSVVGIDISPEATAHAKATYKATNIDFVTASIEELPFPNQYFDLVVSFETLEHVDEGAQSKFLHEVKRVLAPGGILLVSTPNKEVYQNVVENHFHIKELTLNDFRKLLDNSFENVQIFSQKFEVCNAITGSQDSYACVKNGISAQETEYLIALCSANALPVIQAQMTIYPENKLKKLTNWAVSTHRLNEQCNTAIVNHAQELSASEKRHVQELSDLEKKHARELADSEKRQAQEKANMIDQHKKAYVDYTALQKHESEELKQIIANKEGHINLLLESDRELEKIYASRSWRLACSFNKAGMALFPFGSKRRLVAKIFWKIARHPVLFLKKASPKRVKTFFRLLKTEGEAGAFRRIDQSLVGLQVEHMPLEINKIICETKKIEEYPQLRFPQIKGPCVSIIIPVYNQFEYTYNCLASILKNSGDVAYEIIIADDCSTDLTTQITEIIEGVHVVATPENLRFLRNCNNAAKQAQGRYILFLNNDTQVQKNWLAPLVEILESHQQVGMVGSKLVYENGALQEAGGIFWKDASAWNFGNGSDPELSEFNYVKEVDYISGAAIMIRKELWEDIGGFDERFAPAYCEDADLAFEIRKRGLKVFYQPASVVVHFEGISNGKDVSSGQKAYQVINRKKMLEKWEDVLEAENFENAQNVFLARDRSQKKKTLLVVDHYVPHFDKDAGSRSTFQYITLFVNLGYNVKFIGDNFYPHQPYTAVLQQMGVEVLYGPHYNANWKSWIKENGKYIDLVFLNRPHISVKYIDLLREYSSAKIVYFGHDLHFLRERRKFEVTGDKEAEKMSAKWKKDEINLMRKADVSYYVSSVEIAEIKNIDPTIACKAIPINILEKRNPEVFDSSREGLVFVGGFGHDPNIDAVKWLYTEILPIVKKSLPEVKTYIVGSNPTEEIQKMGDEQFIVTGYVSDEELACLYAKCRLAVVPLRYGAGVKGKVIEAMHNQIPLVTTSIGAEGIDDVDDCIFIENDEETFARCIIDSYVNMELLSDKATKGIEYVNSHFSSEAVVKVIEGLWKE